MTISLEAYQAIQRDVDFERGAARKLASDKLHLEVEVARLREVLGTLCYEAHVLVKANSTLSMAGREVKPSFVRLNEAKIAGERVLGDFAAESEGTDP